METEFRYAALCSVLPAEVNGGVAEVLRVGFGCVAMRERAEKRVGKQAGYLNLWQSDGCSLSALKQRDGLNMDTLRHHQNEWTVNGKGSSELHTFFTCSGSFKANAAIFGNSAQESFSPLGIHWNRNMMIDDHWRVSTNKPDDWTQTLTFTNLARPSNDHCFSYFGL